MIYGKSHSKGTTSSFKEKQSQLFKEPSGAHHWTVEFSHSNIICRSSPYIKFQLRNCVVVVNLNFLWRIGSLREVSSQRKLLPCSLPFMLWTFHFLLKSWSLNFLQIYGAGFYINLSSHGFLNLRHKNFCSLMTWYRNLPSLFRLSNWLTDWLADRSLTTAITNLNPRTQISPTSSPTYTPTHSSGHTPTHSPTHSATHSPTNSLTHSLTHSLTYAPTH